MTQLYKLHQPNLDKINITSLVSSKEFHNQTRITDEALQKANSPEYLHWRDLRFKSWIPEIFAGDHEKFWAFIKFKRRFMAQPTPICDADCNFFTWQKLPSYDKFLHEIDLDMARYLLNFSNISKADHEKYQYQGIIEEAIASAQLEGAHTTRKAAKAMLEEKRKPRNKDEKMIHGNFMAMKFIQEKYKNEKLSLKMIFELHRILTEGSDLKEHERGKFRHADEAIIVGNHGDNSATYKAPPIEFVEQEITRLIDFANNKLEGDFIHPVIKAIMLHFWIGLLHPFVDGNGRLARCLFYWYLLREDYWAFAFLPISIAIKSSPIQYSNAYIYSEQDDNDLTYFIDYNLRKIKQAVENFRNYVRKKSHDNQVIEEFLNKHKDLNARQVQALVDMYKNPNKLLTLTIHMNINNIGKVTASKDLKELLHRGFVSAEKRGRNVFYHPTKKLI